MTWWQIVLLVLAGVLLGGVIVYVALTIYLGKSFRSFM